jgi:hypothetical protein
MPELQAGSNVPGHLPGATWRPAQVHYMPLAAIWQLSPYHLCDNDTAVSTCHMYNHVLFQKARMDHPCVKSSLYPHHAIRQVRER